VAVVLATTGRARRCPAESTNVGRPAFARPPRIRRLTQLTNLQRDAATLRGSDEETIACGAPADSEKRSTRYCAAQLPATNTIAETRRQLTRRWRAAAALQVNCSSQYTHLSLSVMSQLLTEAVESVTFTCWVNFAGDRIFRRRRLAYAEQTFGSAHLAPITWQPQRSPVATARETAPPQAETPEEQIKKIPISICVFIYQCWLCSHACILTYISYIDIYHAYIHMARGVAVCSKSVCV